MAMTEIQFVAKLREHAATDLPYRRGYPVNAIFLDFPGSPGESPESLVERARELARKTAFDVLVKGGGHPALASMTRSLESRLEAVDRSLDYASNFKSDAEAIIVDIYQEILNDSGITIDNIKSRFIRKEDDSFRYSISNNKARRDSVIYSPYFTTGGSYEGWEPAESILVDLSYWLELSSTTVANLAKTYQYIKLILREYEMALWRYETFGEQYLERGVDAIIDSDLKTRGRKKLLDESKLWDMIRPLISQSNEARIWSKDNPPRVIVSQLCDYLLGKDLTSIRNDDSKDEIGESTLIKYVVRLLDKHGIPRKLRGGA